MKRCGVLWMLLFLLTARIGAKEVQISLSASHNLAFVGDRIGITLLVKANTEVDRISAELSINKQVCEMLGQDSVVKRVVPEGVVFEQRFELAFFELGDFDIGPAQVTLYSPSGKPSGLKSNLVPITIRTILKDQQTELEPGKPPLSMPGSPWYLLRLIWLPLTVIVLAGAIFLVLRKGRRKQSPAPAPRSPLQTLELELQRLFAEQLFEKGFQILFSLRLTQSLKKFLHAWHAVNAEEMTTDEICVKMNGLTPDPGAWTALNQILSGTDLVKFARYEMKQDEFAEIRDRIGLIVASYQSEERRRTAALLAAQGGKSA